MYISNKILQQFQTHLHSFSLFTLKIFFKIHIFTSASSFLSPIKILQESQTWGIKKFLLPHILLILFVSTLKITFKIHTFFFFFSNKNSSRIPISILSYIQVSFFPLPNKNSVKIASIPSPQTIVLRTIHSLHSNNERFKNNDEHWAPGSRNFFDPRRTDSTEVPSAAQRWFTVFGIEPHLRVDPLYYYTASPDIYDPLFTHRALRDEWRRCRSVDEGKGEKRKKRKMKKKRKKKKRRGKARENIRWEKGVRCSKRVDYVTVFPRYSVCVCVLCK